MNIQFQHNEKNGVAFLEKEGEKVAEMTFNKTGETLLIIDHTDVHESLRGQGVGRKLLDKIVEFARENEKKILPLCPYAKSVFKKDESIRDVLK